MENNYGHATVQTFYRLMEGVPLNSLKKDFLRNIKDSAILFGESDLYEFIDFFLKLPAGSLSDDYKSIKLSEETESTKILKNTPFKPQNDGSWVLSGKELAEFGWIEGLIDKGFKKQAFGAAGGETVLIGPDGSKFLVKSSDLPIAKITLKQIEEGFEIDNIDSELPPHHYENDFILDTAFNKREVFSAYINSGKNLEKTLDILLSNNYSIRKIYDMEGRDFCLKYLKKFLNREK